MAATLLMQHSTYKKIMTTQKLISLFPLVFIITATISSWRSFRLDFPPALKLFSVAWTLVLLVEIAGHIMGFFNIHNQWMYNIFFALWFLTLALSYRQQIVNPVIRKIITGFCIILPLMFLGNIFFLQGIRNLQTLFFVAGGSFMIFLAIAYFRQLYLSEDNEKVTRDPFFWFTIGLLIYFGGNVPYLGMYNYLNKTLPDFSIVYGRYISNAFIILLNCFVTVGFLCRTYHRK